MDETAASGSKFVAFNFEERVRLNVWILFEMCLPNSQKRGSCHLKTL